MKKRDKILTYEQAKELKWFCDNCTGLKQEYYAITDIVNKFTDKLDRLQRTASLIEDFFKKNPGEEIDESGMRT